MSQSPIPQQARSQPDPEPDWFSITITHPRPALSLVGVGGEIDMAATPQLDVRLDDELHDERCRSLILDMSEVTFLDAHGISSMLRARSTARARRIRMEVVIRLTGSGRPIALLGLDRQLPIQRSLDAALDQVPEGPRPENS
ncbi:STAS domain-containing protein [Actinomycetes bacterium KLBMP 9759]